MNSFEEYQLSRVRALKQALLSQAKPKQERPSSVQIKVPVKVDESYAFEVVVAGRFLKIGDNKMLEVESPLAQSLLEDICNGVLPKELLGLIRLREDLSLGVRLKTEAFDRVLSLRPNANDLTQYCVKETKADWLDAEEVVLKALYPRIGDSLREYRFTSYDRRPIYRETEPPLPAKQPISSLMSKVRDARLRLAKSSQEVFPGVDLRRALLRTLGHEAAAVQIAAQSQRVLPDVRCYKLWRTVRFEKRTVEGRTLYISINVIFVPDQPKSIGEVTGSIGSTTPSVPISEDFRNVLVLLRLSPVKQDTAIDGRQYCFRLPSIQVSEQDIIHLKRLLIAESGEKHQCTTDVSHPAALPRGYKVNSEAVIQSINPASIDMTILPKQRKRKAPANPRRKKSTINE